MPFDFAKNQTVENLDNVPADFQPFYKEGEDGTFALDTENAVVGKSVTVIAGLNKALAKSRKEAKDASGKAIDLTPLAEYGEDPEAIMEAFQVKIDEMGKSKGKASADDLQRQLDKARADWDKASSAEKEAMVKRNDGLLGQLRKHLVSDRLTQAMIEEGVDDPDLLMPHVATSVSAREEDGVFVVRVVDEEGDIRHGATGTEMTLRERVQEMKGMDKYGRFFKSEAPSGGGAPPGGASRRPAKTPEKLSPTDKIKVGLDKGQYQRGGRAPSR